jgi:hypothetical protein
VLRVTTRLAFTAICLFCGCCAKDPPAATSSGGACKSLLAAIDRAQTDLESLGKASPEAGPDDAVALPRKTAVVIESLKKAVTDGGATGGPAGEATASIAMLADLALEALRTLDVESKRLAEIQLSLSTIEAKGNEELEGMKKALLDLDAACGAASRPACKAAREAIASLEEPLPGAYDPQTAKLGAVELARRFESLAKEMRSATGDDDARGAIASGAEKGARAYAELANGMDELGAVLERASVAQRSTETTLGRLDAELRAAEEACKGSPK